MNLGKISKWQKSHQNSPRKFKQNLKVGEKSALSIFPNQFNLEFFTAYKPNGLALFFPTNKQHLKFVIKLTKTKIKIKI